MASSNPTTTTSPTTSALPQRARLGDPPQALFPFVTRRVTFVKIAGCELQFHESYGREGMSEHQLHPPADDRGPEPMDLAAISGESISPVKQRMDSSALIGNQEELDEAPQHQTDPPITVTTKATALGPKGPKPVPPPTRSLSRSRSPRPRARTSTSQESDAWSTRTQRTSLSRNRSRTHSLSSDSDDAFNEPPSEPASPQVITKSKSPLAAKTKPSPPSKGTPTTPSARRGKGKRHFEYGQAPGRAWLSYQGPAPRPQWGAPWPYMLRTGPFCNGGIAQPSPVRYRPAFGPPPGFQPWQ